LELESEKVLVDVDMVLGVMKVVVVVVFYYVGRVVCEVIESTMGLFSFVGVLDGMVFSGIRVSVGWFVCLVVSIVWNDVGLVVVFYLFILFFLGFCVMLFMVWMLCSEVKVVGLVVVRLVRLVSGLSVMIVSLWVFCVSCLSSVVVG